MLKLKFPQVYQNLNFYISENTGKFFLRDLVALTNGVYYTSQRGALLHRFVVISSLLATENFPQFSNLFCSECLKFIQKHFEISGPFHIEFHTLQSRGNWFHLPLAPGGDAMFVFCSLYPPQVLGVKINILDLARFGTIYQIYFGKIF